MLEQIGLAAIVAHLCERGTVQPGQSSDCRIGVVYSDGSIDLDRLLWL